MSFETPKSVPDSFSSRKGFVHRAVKGNREAITATLGLIFGGLIVGVIEGNGPAYGSLSPPTLLLSGFLVGLGTKVLSD